MVQNLVESDELLTNTPYLRQIRQKAMLEGHKEGFEEFTAVLDDKTGDEK